MSRRRQIVALILAAILSNYILDGHACGPFSIDPIFVFDSSPDLPFTQYARGNLGIVRPTFGRKTLFIAYRYLNGNWFSDDEQAALVAALKGTAPEDDGTAAVKAWIAARKEILTKEEKPPEIYVERQYRGFAFFPNCARNAFEVAAATLKDRAGTYGADDPNVRAWLAAQDMVFQNCQGGGALPEEPGPASPSWLRKDRDYQIAAALFYSLKFDEAKERFEKIAEDAESPWKQTAEYLIARTLVRQASLTRDGKKQLELYDQVGPRLQMLVQRHGELADAAQKLFALVEYRAHPEPRVKELARSLAHQSGDPNLKQNLIDYVWLLDKLEDRILKEEEARRKAAEPPDKKKESGESSPETQIEKTYQAIRNGELISIMLIPKTADGKPDTSTMTVLYFKPDVPEPEVARQFEAKIGRPLIPDEQHDVHTMYEMALKQRADLLSPNNTLSRSGLTDHEGCDSWFDSDCERLRLDLMPDYLSSEDLTDWIFTVQTTDPNAYSHALTKWHETQSTAWLVAALLKARKSSAHLERLIQDAQRIDRTSVAFPTIAYNVIRLKVDQGKSAEARNMLDEVLASHFEELPVSARNQFLDQRMHLAVNLSDFLRFAQRKAVAFFDDENGGRGSMRDLLRFAKGEWYWYQDSRDMGPNQPRQTREEFEQEIDESYKELLPWDDRVFFDDETIDIVNQQFSLADLEQAARDPVLPEYLHRSFVLAVWTRAVVLKKAQVEARIAPEVIKVAPEMRPVFDAYLKTTTEKEKAQAALFVLLRYPTLSPLLTLGIPKFHSAEDEEYYFETAWWCAPSDTEYNVKEERDVPRLVRKPDFLTAPETETARREHAALIAIGDGKSYLGKQVIEWAKQAPDDPRLPEALFIAAEANRRYKYGCKSWESDEETEKEAERLLLTRYPQSSWAAQMRSRSRP